MWGRGQRLTEVGWVQRLVVGLCRLLTVTDILGSGLARVAVEEHHVTKHHRASSSMPGSAGSRGRRGHQLIVPFTASTTGDHEEDRAVRGRLRVDFRHLRASARGAIVSTVLLALVNLWGRQKLRTCCGDVIHYSEAPARTHSPGDARGHGDHGARRQVASRLARQKRVLGKHILPTAPLLLKA